MSSIRHPAEMVDGFKLDNVIKLHVLRVLEHFEWHMVNTARALDIDRRTLYRMIERYKISRPLGLEHGAFAVGASR